MSVSKLGRPRWLVAAAATACLGACLSGCVVYRGGSVPPVNLLTAAPAKKPVVSYELKADSNIGGTGKLREISEQTLQSSLLQVGADPKLNGSYADPDLSMVVEITVRGNAGAQFLSGFLSGLTFAIVPAYAAVDFALVAAVTERSGSQRQYHYADTVTLWIQLFLLPFSKKTAGEVEDALVADLVRSPVRDMQRDGLLPR